MSLCDIHCGCVVGESSMSALASRAANAVLMFSEPRAVCMDPKGMISVESPRTSCEGDLIGVYRPEAGILALGRLILEDIRAEAFSRNLTKAQRNRARVA